MHLVSLILVLCVLSMAPAPGAAEPVSNRNKPAPALDLFEKGDIPRVRLELSDEAMDRLRQSPRKYVVGAVLEGNRRYTNVAIRLKGGPGSFRQLDDRPAFTVNFDKLAPGQTFHGLKKIHLNNSVQDSSLLSEKIGRNNFRIFHDVSTDRMVFLPQGSDQTFQRKNIGAMPGMSGLVAKAVLEVPEFKERFQARDRELLTNTFQTDLWVKRLREVAARVRRELAETSPSTAESYLSRAASYRRRIQQRLDALRTELGQ